MKEARGHIDFAVELRDILWRGLNIYSMASSILKTMGSSDPRSANTGSTSPRQSAFVLSNPPLAALHNMTEMKVPTNSTLLNPNSAYSQSSFKPPSFQEHLGNAFSLNGTPHGISDILSRSGMANALGQLGLGPRLNVNAAAAAAAANAYFGNPAARFPKLAEIGQARSHLYWPGMLPSPAWRTSGEIM